MSEDVDPYASRAPVGRLNGIFADPGTILGPDRAGQWFVAIRSDDRGSIVAFATATDMDTAAAREPQSMAELKLTRP